MCRYSPLAISLLAFMLQTPGHCQTGTPAQVVIDHTEDLNRAFIFSADDVAKAISRGEDYAKRGKSYRDLAKDNIQQPRGIKGEKGRSHESFVTCYSLNALDIATQAFNSTNNYEQVAVADSVKAHGGHADTIAFQVILTSTPKVASMVFERNRTAAAEDVRVTRFLLTDDAGNIINPIQTDTGDGIQKGTMTLSGVYPIIHMGTSESDTTEETNAYDSKGHRITEHGTESTTSTWTEFQPWSEQHPYYSATYYVNFPEFDENGHALIKKEAKSITLHMITPNSEKIATYDLHPPKL